MGRNKSQNKQHSTEAEQPQDSAPLPLTGDQGEDELEEAVDVNIERDEVTQLLRCEFSNDERLEIAETLTQKMYGRETKQQEFDAIKKHFNSELAAMDEEVKKLQRLVHDGYELRSIPCQVERNYNTNTYIVTRLDTGEVVDQRALRPSELQRRMFQVREQAEQHDPEPVPVGEE